MAEATYNIVTKVSVDNSGFKKGVNEAQKSSKKLSSTIANITKGFGKGGLLGAVSSAGLALGGIGLALNTAIKGFQAISKAIGECTNAYKNQLVVERALDTAIQNSPYVSGSASKSLKEFASEMQRTSNLGDEEVIPMMTQLIATGRSEAEVMQIIKTASDMASSGAMSFDTAVTQLNATLNGNIGRLGMQNAELKGLTDEELKSGKAVEILAEKYKGLSEATIDTSKQLQNIKGDFKEALGQFTLPSSDMWNKFWIGFYEKGIDAINKINDAMDKSIVGKGIAGTLETELKKLTDSRERRLYAEDEIHLISDDQLKALRGYLESLKKLNKEQEVLLKVAQDETESRVYLSKLYEEMDREEAERQKTIEAQKEAEDEIVKLKEEYLKKVAEQEAKWQNIKTITGEEVKVEEKIKFYQDSLVDLMTKANGQISTNNQLYKDQIKIIQDIQAQIKPKEEEKETSDVWVEKIRQQAIKRLEAEKESYEATVDLEKTTALQRYLVRKDFNDRLLALQREQLKAEMEKALKSVEGTANEYEEKARIIEYYNKEIEDLQKGFTLKLEAEGKKSGVAWAKGFSVVLKGVKTTIQGVISLVKGIKGIANIFKNLFKFDTGDALDSVLAFEDTILTFFVETLPKIPQFVASVIQSIQVLLTNIFEGGGLDSFMAVFENLLDMAIEGIDWLFGKLTSYIPKIVKMVISLVQKITKKLPQVLKILLPAILSIITDIIKQLPSFINTMLPTLLESAKVLIMEIINNLPQIIQALVEALPQIIVGVINAVSDFIKNLTVEDLATIIASVIKAIGTLVWGLIQSIPKILEALLDLFVEVVKHMGEVFVKAFEKAWTGAKWLLGTIIDFVKKIFGYANGTNDARRGLALVGEQGPELVRFNGGEQVLNTKNTQKALANAGNGGGSVFNITFENTVDTTAFAMMKQLKQYQRNLAINGVL